MKTLIFYTSHRQLEEIKYSALFFQQFPINSILKQADIMLVHGNPKIDSQKLEEYLNMFPNKNKRLLYTKQNEGYLWGSFEKLYNFFYLFKDYHYVINTNPDVYITRDNEISNLLLDNLNNDIVYFVNMMRGSLKKGFSADFQIFKPTLFKKNYFKIYKNKYYRFYFNILRKFNRKFTTELMLQKMIRKNNLKHKILYPSYRYQREIDPYGIWHCHDNERVKKYLSKSQSI